MMTKGDKLAVVKKVASFLDEGDIVEVVDVDDNGMISFAFGENFMHKGLMSSAECEEHFEKIKVEEKNAPSITEEHIDRIIENSEFVFDTVFGKCTIVSCRLPNGFVIVESSACVSPENYDEKMGIEICFDKIVNKIWELEGYKLQDAIYEQSITNKEIDEVEDYCNEDCCDDCDFSCCNDCDYNNW